MNYYRHISKRQESKCYPHNLACSTRYNCRLVRQDSATLSLSNLPRLMKLSMHYHHRSHPFRRIRNPREYIVHFCTETGMANKFRFDLNSQPRKKDNKIISRKIITIANAWLEELQYFTTYFVWWVRAIKLGKKNQVISKAFHRIRYAFYSPLHRISNWAASIAVVLPCTGSNRVHNVMKNLRV